MTKEELKRRQYDNWNKYYQRHKLEINARRKKVREDYKNKLSVAENRIKELEQKLEQTEKALADYQFNYPSIEKLSKENAGLKDLAQRLNLFYEGNGFVKRGLINSIMVADYIEMIEKENADLKDIIKRFVTWADSYHPKEYFDWIIKDAKKFLKE